MLITNRLFIKFTENFCVNFLTEIFVYSKKGLYLCIGIAPGIQIPHTSSGHETSARMLIFHCRQKADTANA